ncbi:11605_t:CDS:10 [Diversispora eburnea]|uniref:11605_t:CDS:1 n=1 Tax=Diversispora eburnea TaxID=1213867 RepID=A0A9N9BUK6_9GLOM|nr:11605_t:CDS:10 [Diversispora eburnea]
MKIKNNGNIHEIVGTTSSRTEEFDSPLSTMELRKRKPINYVEDLNSTLESETDSEFARNKMKDKKGTCVGKAPLIENDMESNSNSPDTDIVNDDKFDEFDDDLGIKQDSGLSDLAESDGDKTPCESDLTESDGDKFPCEMVKRNLMNRRIIPNVSKRSLLPLISGEKDSKSVSPLLSSVMREYCGKDSISKFDPAHSYILDLSSTSKIVKEFVPEHWSRFIADRPDVINETYHRELEPILDHLFGKQKKSLRNVKAPEYGGELSYDKGDWEKIIWWIEWAIGRFLDAFESERNLLMQQDCHEREWLGSYLIPIFQGALTLDGHFRVAWGKITVQASLQRRNQNRDILEEKVNCGHMADMLCSTDSYEMLCLLTCGGPYKQYKSEIRIYLMERREVYRLHFIKTLDFPLTFSTYHILRISLIWAWNIQGLLNDLLEKLINDVETGSVTPQWSPNDMATQETPEKNKRKNLKQTETRNSANLGYQ